MKLVIFLISLIAAVSAFTPNARHVVHHRINHPHDWTKLSRASPDAPVRFHFAIKQRNIEALHAAVDAVSNPDSPRFNEHLSMDAVNKMVASDPAHVEQVLSWVRSYNVLATAAEDDVMVVAPVEVVERMFNTEMYTFEHHESKARVVAHMGESSVPHRIGEVIDFVSGISLFPPQNPGPKRASQYPNKAEEVRANGGGPDYAVVPETLEKLYKVPAEPSPKSNYSMGVIEFSPQGAGVEPNDMKKFADEVGGVNQPIFRKVGQWNPVAQVDVEATLDLEYIVAMAPGVDTWFWTGASWLYEFTQDFIKAGEDVPKTISISYGWAESAQCQIADCNQLGVDSKGYVTRVNNEFAKLAAAGISVFVASGDAGAASKLNMQCNQTPNSPINPDYPAASPFITAVGATMLENENELTGGPKTCREQGGCSDGSGTEVVCSVKRALITSGGGFSNYAKVQDPRQLSAVEGWLNTPNNDAPPSTMFNKNGRAYPDISMLGHNYVIVDQGQAAKVDGTSASSPVAAGVFARINSERVANNKKPFGFLNPLIYKILKENPEVFNDVTSGNNKCTEQSMFGSSCCQYGFSATKGYDPVTGAGTINFEKLKKLLDTYP